jgi:hypothetical protein
MELIEINRTSITKSNDKKKGKKRQHAGCNNYFLFGRHIYQYLYHKMIGASSTFWNP